jgi:hypothetical protein
MRTQTCERRACGHCISRTAVGETFIHFLHVHVSTSKSFSRGTTVDGYRYNLEKTGLDGQTNRYSGSTVTGPVYGVSIVDHCGPENEE